MVGHESHRFAPQERVAHLRRQWIASVPRKTPHKRPQEKSPLDDPPPPAVAAQLHYNGAEVPPLRIANGGVGESAYSANARA